MTKWVTTVREMSEDGRVLTTLTTDLRAAAEAATRAMAAKQPHRERRQRPQPENAEGS